jgi:hypothetical protein
MPEKTNTDTHWSYSLQRFLEDKQGPFYLGIGGRSSRSGEPPSAATEQEMCTQSPTLTNFQIGAIENCPSLTTATTAASLQSWDINNCGRSGPATSFEASQPSSINNFQRQVSATIAEPFQGYGTNSSWDLAPATPFEEFPTWEPNDYLDRAPATPLELFQTWNTNNSWGRATAAPVQTRSQRWLVSPSTYDRELIESSNNVHTRMVQLEPFHLVGDIDNALYIRSGDTGQAVVPNAFENDQNTNSTFPASSKDPKTSRINTPGAVILKFIERQYARSCGDYWDPPFPKEGLHQQSPRSDEDMYTPKWIRKTEAGREGW